MGAGRTAPGALSAILSQQVALSPIFQLSLEGGGQSGFLQRPIALNRKNSLFAGHDQGAQNWACLASLVEMCKLNSVNPNAWLANVPTKLVNRWPASRIDELYALGLRRSPLTAHRLRHASRIAEIFFA